jgi:hypothetical protein
MKVKLKILVLLPSSGRVFKSLLTNKDKRLNGYNLGTSCSSVVQ